MLKIKKKKMPKNWEKDVKKYLIIKEAEFIKHAKCCDRCPIIRQYKEVKHIADYLGVFIEN